jgi:transcriptional regulator with XRE-family HTH domain
LGGLPARILPARARALALLPHPIPATLAAGLRARPAAVLEAGTSQPTLEVLRKLAVVLGVSADVLLFDQDERGRDEDFKLQFEALSALSPKEKQVAKAVLDAMIVKNQVAGALDRVKKPAAKTKKRVKRRADAKE